MDQSKQTDGIARDGAHCVEPEGERFTQVSIAANQVRVEGRANRYAEASQPSGIGRRPHPIDGPRLAQSERTAEAYQRNVVQIAKPFAAKTDQRTKVEAKPIKSVPPTLTDYQKQAASGSFPRLMRVEDVAAYLNVSVSKVWRLKRKNPNFPPPIRMDGSTRWDRLDIDRFIEDGKTRTRTGR